MTSTKQFVWCEQDRCEERDISGSLLKNFLGYGELIGPSKFFWVNDHISSIHQFTDNSGLIQAEYLFDLFGRVSKVNEVVAVDFNYSGYYVHSRSGLNLTLTRSYNSALGRWLSRDKIGERSGTNLYAYVKNSPSLFGDPLGLCVEATYSQSTHRFTAHDMETGETITTDNAFSGNGPWANQPLADGVGGRGPIPRGDYDIEQSMTIPERSNAIEYPLTPKSEPPGGRGGFTIHPGSRSNGCVTMRSDKPENDPMYPHNSDFDRFSHMMCNTKPCKDGKKGHLHVTQ